MAASWTSAGSHSTIDPTSDASTLGTMALLSKLVSYTVGASLLLLTLLSPRSRKARYYLNTLLYLGSMGLSASIGIALSLLLALVPNQRLNIQHYVARTFYLLAGTLVGIRFEVEGTEHFPKGQPAVLVGNHQSSMDILFLGSIFPERTSVMAKKELRWAPLLGQWMMLSGAVFVDRASRKDAMKAFERVGQRMRREKLRVWIFPEGTRSKLPVPDLLKFKMGAFHLALQAGVPIVPVVCENYYRFYDSRSRFESGTIRIRVLPPIDVSKYSRETVHDLADHVRDEMLKALRDMDAQADRFDTESVVAREPASSLSSSSKPGSSVTVASNAVPRGHPSGAGLGGVARLASMLVGTGRPGGALGHDIAHDVAKARERFEREHAVKEGKPAEYGLVSEASKQKAQEGLTQRRTNTSGSGSGASSDEVTDGDAVAVKRPPVTAGQEPSVSQP